MREGQAIRIGHVTTSRTRLGATDSRARGQRGFALIEVLLAVFLVGTVVMALAAGMLTMMGATRSTSDQQRLEAGVLTYTEFLRSQPYVDCAVVGTYPVWDEGHGIGGRVTKVRHWSIPPGGTWGVEPFADACGTPDRGRQLLDVVVAFDDGRADAKAQVVLRRNG